MRLSLGVHVKVKFYIDGENSKNSYFVSIVIETKQSFPVSIVIETK